jgi:hypothetical protein
MPEVQDYSDYMRMSLDLNLFFLRIMKEHSFFLQAGFLSKDSSMAREAAEHARRFEDLLALATNLASDGLVSCDVVESGELVTPFTPDAERATQEYTGVVFNPRITRAEAELECQKARPREQGAQEVHELNRKALAAVDSLIAFKRRILRDVTSCRIFTFNYPLLIDHILREANLYASMLERLLSGRFSNDVMSLMDLEAFWNRIMAEHSKFIAGLLDPTEENLIESARLFGKRFDLLTKEAAEATRSTLSNVTRDSLEATQALRDFKAAGTKGILDCEIRSVIIPLLGDHVLREANHFLRLLRRG